MFINNSGVNTEYVFIIKKYKKTCKFIYIDVYETTYQMCTKRLEKVGTERLEKVGAERLVYKMTSIYVIIIITILNPDKR